MSENLAETLRLLLVTDDALLDERDPVAVCRDAVRGGVTAVQLRLKRAHDRELLRLARRLISALSVPVFINDRLDVAMAAGAAGVHLGPDDLAPALARRVAPAGFIIGASVGLATEVTRAQRADYWGVGPYRSTSTKHDAGAALALDGAGRILAMAGRRPCVAIGGVLPDDVADIMAAGFAGVAVVGGILGETDVGTAAARYRAQLDRIR